MAEVKQKWAKLTDDDILLIRGKRDQLIGKIQERYGIAKEAAEEQVDQFHSRLQKREDQDAGEGSERGAIAPSTFLSATPRVRWIR